MAPISAVYAVLAVLFVLALAFNVSLQRRARGIGLGNGDDPVMTLAIRAHANAVEWLPLALLLLLLLELNGAPAVLLHAFGITLLVARLAHAEGLLRHGGGVSVGRFYGTLVTWLLLVAMACSLLILALGQMPGYP